MSTTRRTRGSGSAESAEANDAGATPKRRGRPPGSKNKKRAAETGAAEAAPRRAGGPKGSTSRARSAAPRGRRGRRPASGESLGRRLGALIEQLESLRAEVDRVEAEARQLAAIRAALG